MEHLLRIREATGAERSVRPKVSVCERDPSVSASLPVRHHLATCTRRFAGFPTRRPLAFELLEQLARLNSREDFGVEKLPKFRESNTLNRKANHA